jgi:glycosyltransferase involved in cell wall biosynthesis
MTPLAPGGQNGGAGPVATTLVEQLSRIAPHQQLLLLTNADTHVELASLDAPNVQRLCVRGPQSAQPSLRKRATRHLLDVIPARARSHMKNALWRLRNGQRNASIVDQLRADLLFCPFTVPIFARQGIPTAVIVHDLQHVAYPTFFTHEQRLARERHVQDACARANRIVCVSDHVRQTLLAHVRVDSERVVTIRHGLLRQLLPECPDAEDVPEQPYLLYPANFWPHKNHARLFEALRRFRAQRPSVDLRLVCTGAPNAFQARLRRMAADMLGPDVVLFPGYVAVDAIDALLRGCAAVIYPSLYEGFGMPVLEAMSAGRPVLCSTATSLPEVAGDAALYFNACEPNDILRTLTSLFDHPAYVAQRVAYGRARAARFGDARSMACAYQRLFDEIIAG